MVIFLQFEVYTGKKKGAVEHQLGARVVKDLTKELHGTISILTIFLHHTAYSVIWKRVVCGTARKDGRGFPEKLKTAKFKNR